MNKLKTFYFKSKLNQVSILALPDWQLLCHMIIRLKYFLDRLNIIVILAPCCEFFAAKCTQFHLTSEP